MLFEEIFIDVFNSFYGGLNEGLQSDLVDDPWEAFSQVKDHLDGIIGEEVLRSFGPF